MDFRLDDDERQLIEGAGATLRRHLEPERLLGANSTAPAWTAVADDGWLAAGRPQEDGTEALPLHLLAGIGREAGRVLAGDGFVTNAVLLAAVEDVLAPGFLLVDGRGDAIGGTTTEPTTRWCFGVEPGLEAYRIDAEGVVWSAPADWTFEPVGRLGLSVGAVTVSPRHAPVTKITLTESLLREARIVHAATLVGLGSAAMDLAIEYAKQRIQFGTTIGSFQAVKHALADATVTLEIAWNAVLHAALRPDEETTTIAQLQAKAAADQATRTALQTFGGIGMTWEHSMHLYLKVGQLSRRRFGSSQAHELHLAERALDRLATTEVHA